MIYALDTNIIIHILTGNSSVRMRRDEVINNGDTIVIPPFVHFEIRRGFLYKSAPKKEAAYKILRSSYRVGEMTEESWECAASVYANLRHAGYTVEDADLLIAAFCLVGGITLVTDNIKHFINIPGLRVENWVEY